MRFKRFLSAIGRFFKNLFTQNIAIKIIALLFAFLLWGYVLTIENPEYTKVVRDVEITMIGESSLTDKGLTLVSRDLGETDVSVLCQIGKHSELDASRIDCVVDLSSRAISLSEDEDSKVIPLTVTTTLQSGYGSVTAVEHSTVNVEVARVSTRNNLPVSVEYAGSLPNGFQVTVPDRLTISVSGIKSIVREIAQGTVTIDLSSFPTEDLSALAGEYSGVYTVQFYNSNGEALEGIYNDNGEAYAIEVPITIRAYREIPIVPEIRTLDGYEAEQTLSRRSVTIYGERSVLNELSLIGTEPITALPEMEGETVSAKLVLPEGVSLSAGDDGTVDVTLTVTETVETRDYTIPLTLRGISNDLLRGEDFPTTADIIVTGTTRTLDAFSESYVTLTVNLNGCGVGTHTLPIMVELNTRAGDVTVALVEPEVTLTLTEKPVPEPVE